MKKGLLFVSVLVFLVLLSSCATEKEFVTVNFELYTYNELFESYTRNFSQVESQTVEKGTHISEPTIPNLISKTFAGWYKDKLFKQPWDFNDDILNVDTTLYGYYI